MVAYSFKGRFAEPILAGTKRQTIRADRKRHARPGEELQLYTGMRTRQCRLIGRSLCIGVTPITIDLGRSAIDFGGRSFGDLPALDAFAHSDGFRGWPDMRGFWLMEHPALNVFSGWLIGWGDLL